MKKQFDTNNHRSIIMEASVRIEQMVTNQVCLMLGIDKSVSDVFGNGPRAISFNTKISMLNEFNYFDKIDKQKFERFAQIRNKFAHLAEITTFEECINSIDGLKKKLSDWYPKVNIDSKDVYNSYILLLLVDIISHIDKFVAFYNQKVHIQNEQYVKADFFDNFIQNLEKLVDEEYLENQPVMEFVARLLELVVQIANEKSKDSDAERSKIRPSIL